MIDANTARCASSGPLDLICIWTVDLDSIEQKKGARFSQVTVEEIDIAYLHADSTPAKVVVLSLYQADVPKRFGPCRQEERKRERTKIKMSKIDSLSFDAAKLQVAEYKKM